MMQRNVPSVSIYDTKPDFFVKKVPKYRMTDIPPPSGIVTGWGRAVYLYSNFTVFTASPTRTVSRYKP